MKHDFTESALSQEGHDAKDETRRRPLRAVRESAFLWSECGKTLRYDWMELAGAGAPTLEVLQQNGALNSTGRFIGVDREASIIEGCKAKYGPHAPATWLHGDFSRFLNPNMTVARNVGVLVFDSEDGIWREKWSTLEVAVKFARVQYERIGEFLLVVNAVAPKRRLSDGDLERYRGRLAALAGVPVRMESLQPYKSKVEEMLWTMITFGF